MRLTGAMIHPAGGLAGEGNTESLAHREAAPLLSAKPFSAVCTRVKAWAPRAAERLRSRPDGITMCQSRAAEGGEAVKVAHGSTAPVQLGKRPHSSSDLEPDMALQITCAYLN